MVRSWLRNSDGIQVPTQVIKYGPRVGREGIYKLQRGRGAHTVGVHALTLRDIAIAHSAHDSLVTFL